MRRTGRGVGASILSPQQSLISSGDRSKVLRLTDGTGETRTSVAFADSDVTVDALTVVVGDAPDVAGVVDAREPADRSIVSESDVVPDGSVTGGIVWERLRAD